MVLSLLLSIGVWPGEAVGQIQNADTLDKNSAEYKKVETRLKNAGFGISFAVASGTRITAPANKVTLARKIRDLLKEVKADDDFKRKLRPGRDLLIRGILLTTTDGMHTIEVTLLIAGKPNGLPGRTTIFRPKKLTNPAANLDKGIFICTGGDAKKAATRTDKPGEGGAGTVFLPGRGVAIAFGGRGGDARSQGATHDGGKGGKGFANGQPGQGIGIGGFGGDGAVKEDKDTPATTVARVGRGWRGMRSTSSRTAAPAVNALFPY